MGSQTVPLGERENEGANSVEGKMGLEKSTGPKPIRFFLSKGRGNAVPLIQVRSRLKEVAILLLGNRDWPAVDQGKKMHYLEEKGEEKKNQLLE